MSYDTGMISAIIFDCFGVLTGDKWKEFVAALPYDQQQPARDLNHALDGGFITQVDFFKQIAALTGVVPERVESVINAEMHKNKPLLSFIRELKKSYKIGLLSNISSNWIIDTFLSPDEVTLFDDIVLSHTVGMTKPNPAIFRLAAKRLQCEPSQCTFIDDGELNCEAASQEGMQTIVYRDFIQFKREIESLLLESNNK
jgi:HAD superfamily hydrolase (TIGR01509 family)